MDTAQIVGIAAGYIMVAVLIFSFCQNDRRLARKVLADPYATAGERTDAAKVLRSASRGALGAFVFPLMFIYLIIAAVIRTLAELVRDAR